MRVSGKSLLKASTRVPTASNGGPASSRNVLTAMGVVECSHSTLSAEVCRELGEGPMCCSAGIDYTIIP